MLVFEGLHASIRLQACVSSRIEIGVFRLGLHGCSTPRSGLLLVASVGLKKVRWGSGGLGLNLKRLDNHISLCLDFLYA